MHSHSSVPWLFCLCVWMDPHALVCENAEVNSVESFHWLVSRFAQDVPLWGNIVWWVFHPTRWLARFSLIWKCLSFKILNILRTLSSWASDHYRPSAPLLYEVASHVKQLPFRPILLLLLSVLALSSHTGKNKNKGEHPAYKRDHLEY